MKKSLVKVTSWVGALALVSVAGPALAGVTTMITMAPGPLLIRPVANSSQTLLPANPPTGWTWTDFSCLTSDQLGNVQLSFSGISCAAPSSGWGPWRRAMINVPWSANPGSGIGLAWSSVEPANTSIAARLVSLNANNTVQSVEAFQYGGGGKSQGTAVRGDGALLLEVAMRTQSGSTTPILTSVSGDVYAQ